ncbi:uncharacterized protein LOC135160005 [Diachasmimorpha longicaudata]|uniref:uncharacterized protein LOC135160005 n=1 Tax=Diachasmimorpha longicaudata TaxID=58733 RepID=UPI0030B8AE76
MAHFALQSHEDSQPTSPYIPSVQDARGKLQKFMAACPINDERFLDFKAMEKLEDYDPEITIDDERESPQITAFIDGIIANARAVTSEGNEFQCLLPTRIDQGSETCWKRIFVVDCGW